MTSPPDIKGWCPGALRPMASVDGLLFRAKAIGSRLTAAQAAEIAAISRRCGNGAIDLSQRAQLQLRGLTEATLPQALSHLAAIGMLAPDAVAESVMNVLASPLAGQGAAHFDANDVAIRLVAAIEADSELRKLPGKFLFLVDDASPLSLAGVEADIRIEAQGEGARVSIAGTAESVSVAAEGIVETATALARAFVALRAGNAFDWRRMARLVEARGADVVFDTAGLAERTPRAIAPGTTPGDVFGAQAHNGVFFAGVGAPFGRWRAEDLALLASLAQREGCGELRLTPWRALLVPAVTQGAAQRIAQAAAERGLLVEGDDARLAIAACPGAPECPQALGDTRSFLEGLGAAARALAGEDGVGLHVSGCAKGCAHPAAAPATLVTRGDVYDLIDKGRAGDAPSATGLTRPALIAALAARAAEGAA